MSVLTTLSRIFIGRRLQPYKFVRSQELLYKHRINQIGLYIHIPFCRKICNFCPYNKILYNKKLAKEYVPALKRELIFVKKKLPGIKINSIYVGGGTPALLKEGLGEVFNFIQKNFKVEAEIAVELHPRDSTDRTLRYLKRIGVSMVSVGIQSFDKEILEKLTRYEIEYNLKESLVRALNAGFKCVDVDLIFGMRGIPPEKHIEDFNIAIDLGCDQISTYPLIPFTYTSFGKRHFNQRDILSSEKQRKLTLESFAEVAKKRGYIRSSIWSFTKKDSMRYSSITRNSFIGIGASATSLIGNLFTINTFSVPDYINETFKRIPIALYCSLSERDEGLWWLFWQCYNTVIISSEFKGLFGKDLCKTFRQELGLGKLFGLLIQKGNDFYLTQKGAYLFHLIEQAYTHSYLDKTWKTCMFDPWPKELTLS
jgi:oxygen-independent coproporphyrinogen-3 oxidase